jgi:hypothetical protein
MDFTPPPPPLPPMSKRGLKLVCNVNIVYGKFKSKNGTYWFGCGESITRAVWRGGLWESRLFWALKWQRASKLCPETSTKWYVHEFGFCSSTAPPPPLSPTVFAQCFSSCFLLFFKNFYSFLLLLLLFLAALLLFHPSSPLYTVYSVSCFLIPQLYNCLTLRCFSLALGSSFLTRWIFRTAPHAAPTFLGSFTSCFWQFVFAPACSICYSPVPRIPGLLLKYLWARLPAIF